jgi:hypothetical protein
VTGELTTVAAPIPAAMRRLIAGSCPGLGRWSSAS